jgi:hypothetical protein
MKNSMMLICAVLLGISLCAGVSASAAEKPAFTVDSPFDLTLGSTNYAVRLGKSVRSNTSARYDPATKVTTTNWSAYGSVRLSAPYHGVKFVSLDFKGEERRLDSFCFDIGEKKLGGGGTLSVEECRNVMKEIADDISNRFGVKMEASKYGGELSDEYRFLAYEESLADTAEFFAELEKEELMEEKPSGVVFAKCPDGDVVLLLEDGAVVRFNHEAPEVWEKWESLAEFFEDNTEEEG